MPKQNLLRDLELSLAVLQAKRALKEPLPRYGRYLRRHALRKIEVLATNLPSRRAQ